MRQILHKKKKYLAIVTALGFVVLGFSAIAPFLAEQISTPATPIKSHDEELLGTGGLPKTITLAPYEQTKTIESPTFKAKFSFNALAPHWKEIPGDEGYGEHRTIKLRVSDDGKNWGDWTELHIEGPLRENDPHPDKIFPEAPLFIDGKFFQFSLTITRPAPNAKAPEISEMVMTYIDSREDAIQRTTRAIIGAFAPKAAHAAEQDQGPSIVTRAGWGSPDPYGNAFRDTHLDWRPTYEPVKQVFVHHTVHSNSSSDFASVVRAIWQFHAHTRGWGDIGYNYLVDGNGIVYEGRFGGDNVVGGHVLGFNRGSIGVALIGCFQANNSTCVNLNGGNSGPSSPMLNSLYNLLGWKTKGYEIDPLTSHTFCGGIDVNYECRNFPTITGHRDGSSTTCPGSYVYDMLPTIRDAAESRRANLFPYAAKQLSFDTITSTSGDTAITLQFKNTGSSTWSKTSPRFFLKTANPDDHGSAFEGSGWITGQHTALLNEESVPPGSVGTFTFNLTGQHKPPGLYYEHFRLVAEGVTDLRNYFTVRIQAPTYEWSHVSTTYGTGTTLMNPGQEQTITVVAKNTGTATWVNNGSYPMRLGTWPPQRTSSFQHASWSSPERYATLQETSVAPGANGTFTFTVCAPSREAEYSERFNLVAENRSWAADAEKEMYFRVANPYSWQPAPVSHSLGTALMDPGETQTITVLAKNTGTETWTKNGDYPVRLGTWQPERSSAVQHSSWLSPIRPASLQEDSVAPGANGTFIFTVRAPSTGEFFERVNLVAEGLTWFNDPGLQFYLRGRANYSWQVVSLNHSSGTAALPAGSTVTLTLRARNVGDTTWKRSGDYPVRLGTVQPQNRGSVFYRPGWLRDFRPTTLQETSVAPGEIGTFTFEAQVPTTPGEYHERFSLVAENLRWFNDPGMSFYIKSF